MMTFRDMTFCAAFCATTDCPRNYSDAVRAAAERWWNGPGAPVAFADMSKGCDDFSPTGGVNLPETADTGLGASQSQEPAKPNGRNKTPYNQGRGGEDVSLPLLGSDMGATPRPDRSGSPLVRGGE